jgi:hypothetical protein
MAIKTETTFLVNTDEKLLSDMQSRLLFCKNARQRFEKQWYVDLAFYRGKHYVNWLQYGNTSRLVETPKAKNRVRIVSNRCRMQCRSEIAKLTKERPRGFVKPNTGDDIDRVAAKAGGQLYDSLYEPSALNIAAKKLEAIFWCSVIGNGFLKIYFDKNKLDFTGIKGSLVVEALSSFAMYVPDVLEVDEQCQEYIIQKTTKSEEWLKNNYSTAVMTSSSGDSRFSAAMDVESANKAVDVYEAWIKPCKMYSKGLWCCWTDTAILDKMYEFPYKHGQYPYVKYNSVPTGKFFNDSILVDTIPLQLEYNRSFSQLLEVRNATSKPMMLAQKGSIDPNRVTNEPGAIVEYLPGTPSPALVPPPHMPGYVSDLLNRTQRDMDDYSGLNEKIPAGVVAAVAISYIQEENDAKLAPALMSVEIAEQRMATQILSLFSQYCTVERMIKIVGNDSAFEVKAFKSSTLRGNTDYSVEIGSSIPRSRAARQAFLLELHGRKIIEDPAVILKHLDMTETASMYDSLKVDTRHAERENLMLAEGLKTMLDINSFDNHIEHITAHEKFQKTQQYDILSDKIKTMLSDHVMLHYAQLASMYGRSDLIPKPLIVDNVPLLDAAGKPRIEPVNPALYGFYEQLKLHGPPPPVPPVLPPPIPMEPDVK